MFEWLLAAGNLSLASGNWFLVKKIEEEITANYLLLIRCQRPVAGDKKPVASDQRPGTRISHAAHRFYPIL